MYLTPQYPTSHAFPSEQNTYPPTPPHPHAQHPHGLKWRYPRLKQDIIFSVFRNKIEVQDVESSLDDIDLAKELESKIKEFEVWTKPLLALFFTLLLVSGIELKILNVHFFKILNVDLQKQKVATTSVWVKNNNNFY